MLVIRNLTAMRGERLLFEDVSFEVESNEMLLIKGRNGAGKTSLLRLICGLATPDAGEILWKSESIENIRPAYSRSLLYVGHDNGISLDLTVLENLEFHRALNDNPSNHPIPEILERLRIVRYLNVPCRFLSAGQKRRVALARLAISESKLWLLDEPFSSLDDQASETVVELVEQHLNSDGLCLMTSHQTIDWRDLKTKQIQLGQSG